MVIKIKNQRKRAEITKEFLDLLSDSIKIRTANMKMQIKEAGEFKKHIISNLNPTIMSLKKLSTKDGMDKGLTILRNLPVEKYSASHYEFLSGRNEGDEMNFFKITTEEIIMREENPRRQSAYKIGKYAIYIAMEDFINNRTSNIHMIPLSNPFVKERHPHHVATEWDESWTGISEVNNRLDLVTPLDARPHTCWGDFGPLMVELYSSFSIIEVVQYCVTFLQRYNSFSPLRSPGYMSHMEEI